MKTSLQEAKDKKYLQEWEKFWSGLTPEQREEYRARGIEGPELTTYETPRKEFDVDRVVCTAEVSQVPTVLLPELEALWQSDDLPKAIVTTLGDLGSPIYSQFATGSIDLPAEVSVPLRLVLEFIQSEPIPGLGLAITLKWMDSSLMKHSDRALAKLFGVTFQSVSISRERLSQKFGCFIFAGKSEAAKRSYQLSNRKKTNG